MNVAMLEFPTKSFLGVVSDVDAEIIDGFFLLDARLDPVIEGDEPEAAVPEARGPVVLLEHPGRSESTNWMQPGPLDGQSQFVVQNFVALIGTTRMRVDLSKALAAEIFKTTDGHTAIIGGDGVRPAGEPVSAEPLVQRYLASLTAAGVKAVPALTGVGGGRRKVPSASPP